MRKANKVSNQQVMLLIRKVDGEMNSPHQLCQKSLSLIKLQINSSINEINLQAFKLNHKPTRTPLGHGLAEERININEQTNLYQIIDNI